MSNTKHTPGPWKKDEQGDANGNYTIRPDDGSTNGDIHAEVIADVYTEEDALLIATAPELYALAKEFRDFLTIDLGSPKVNRMRANMLKEMPEMATIEERIMRVIEKATIGT